MHVDELGYDDHPVGRHLVAEGEQYDDAHCDDAHSGD